MAQQAAPVGVADYPSTPIIFLYYSPVHLLIPNRPPPPLSATYNGKTGATCIGSSSEMSREITTVPALSLSNMTQTQTLL